MGGSEALLCAHRPAVWNQLPCSRAAASLSFASPCCGPTFPVAEPRPSFRPPRFSEANSLARLCIRLIFKALGDPHSVCCRKPRPCCGPWRMKYRVRPFICGMTSSRLSPFRSVCMGLFEISAPLSLLLPGASAPFRLTVIASTSMPLGGQASAQAACPSTRLPKPNTRSFCALDMWHASCRPAAYQVLRPCQATCSVLAAAQRQSRRGKPLIPEFASFRDVCSLDNLPPHKVLEPRGPHGRTPPSADATSKATTISPGFPRCKGGPCRTSACRFLRLPR